MATRYLKHEDGTIYIWTKELSERAGMQEVANPKIPEPVIQDRLTVKQKVEHGVELSDEDKAAYPDVAKKAETAQKQTNGKK
jgi:hypothetical protein